ncbi:MAG TPA: hypothetical protein VML19_28665 [Verrucomicrobiae bacterium]|nr:hypothetical protein [Verrucomicrobiae bacterium]
MGIEQACELPTDRREETNEGTLYVFLHGLIGVRCHSQPPTGVDPTIELLIPNVGARHSYRIGEFLGETTLQPSTVPYVLRNVEPGPATTFDRTRHLVTRDLRNVCDGADIYARIILPGAATIHSLLQVDLKDVIEDPCDHFRNCKGIATMVPVLEYSFKDPRKVALGGERLNVAPIKVRGRWYMNLHIFAEEDVERVDDHTLGGFDAVTALFDFDCAPKLASVANIAPPNPDWRQRPHGTIRAEFSSLSARTRELGFLGRDVRQAFLHQKPALLHTSSVGADPLTCTTVVTQPPDEQMSGGEK